MIVITREMRTGQYMSMENNNITILVCPYYNSNAADIIKDAELLGIELEAQSASVKYEIKLDNNDMEIGEKLPGFYRVTLKSQDDLNMLRMLNIIEPIYYSGSTEFITHESINVYYYRDINARS